MLAREAGDRCCRIYNPAAHSAGLKFFLIENLGLFRKASLHPRLYAVTCFAGCGQAKAVGLAPENPPPVRDEVQQITGKPVSAHAPRYY